MRGGEGADDELLLATPFIEVDVTDQASQEKSIRYPAIVAHDFCTGLKGGGPTPLNWT